MRTEERQPLYRFKWDIEDMTADSLRVAWVKMMDDSLDLEQQIRALENLRYRLNLKIDRLKKKQEALIKPLG